MIRTVIAATALVPLLSACAYLGIGRNHDMAASELMPGVLEPIHAAAFTRDTALFRVTSNGCTEKADIQPVIEHRNGHALVTLRRVREDTCKVLVADGIGLTYSFQELGLEPGETVQVNNPYLIRQGS